MHSTAGYSRVCTRAVLVGLLVAVGCVLLGAAAAGSPAAGTAITEAPTDGVSLTEISSEDTTAADGDNETESTTIIAQEEPWIRIVVSDAQGKQGEQVTVTVKVEELVEDRPDDQQEALGYNLLFNYDRDVIEFVEAESVTFRHMQVFQDPPKGTPFDPEVSGEYGVLRVADINGDTKEAPPFTAVKLTFELVGEPGDSTTIEIPHKTDDGAELAGVGTNPTDGWPVEFDFGEVTILEEQAPVGNLTGTVTDENGDPLEGATVTAAGTEVTTGSDGTYEMELQNGTYDVSFTADGYSEETAEVTITRGNTTTQDAQLAVAETPTESGGDDGDDQDGSDDSSGGKESMSPLFSIVGTGLGIASIAMSAVLLIVAILGRFTGLVDLS